MLIQAWPQILRVSAVLLPGISALWIAAASAGRAVTLQGLLGERAKEGRGFSSLLGIHFLRAAASLAALLGYLGGLVIAAQLVPADRAADPSYPVLALLVWMAIAGMVALCWAVVNWFLSLSPIFMVRDGMGTFDAIHASLLLLRGRTGAYMATFSWFGLLRSGAVLALLVCSLVAAAAGNGAAAVVLLAVVALAYFVVVDWLYVCRVAAFVELAEPEQPLMAAAEPSGGLDVPAGGAPAAT